MYLNFAIPLTFLWRDLCNFFFYIFWKFTHFGWGFTFEEPWNRIFYASSDQSVEQSFPNYRRFCSQILPIINDGGRLWELHSKPMEINQWFHLNQPPHLKQRAFPRVESSYFDQVPRLTNTSVIKSVGKPDNTHYGATSETQVTDIVCWGRGGWGGGPLIC